MYFPRVCSRDSSFFLKGCNWYFTSMWSFYNNPFVTRAYVSVAVTTNINQERPAKSRNCSLFFEAYYLSSRSLSPSSSSSSTGPVTLLARWSEQEHVTVQGNPLLAQEQRLVRQVPWQPQQTNSLTASGVDARTVHTMSSWQSLSCQPWFSGPMSGDWGSRAHFQIFAL